MTDIKLLGNDDLSWAAVWASNYLVMQQFTAGASGTLKSIRIRTTGNANVVVAIYADSSGSPGSLLVSSASTAVVSGWNTITVPDQAIVSGTVYWLAMDSDTTIASRITTTNVITKYKSATYSGFSFPNPAGTGFSTYTTRNLAIAGWGEEAGAAVSWGGTWGG